MAKNAGSRVFFVLMVLPCILLCIISVVSFSTFAYTHNKIRDKAREGGSREKYCILFVKNKGEKEHGQEKYQKVELGDDGPCAFAIWGQVTVCFASVLLGILFTVKALIGINALSWLTLFETVFIILVGLLDFVVAIVITAGLRQICDPQKYSCERNSIYFNGDYDNGIEYYRNINASKATAWIGTVILAVLAVLHLMVVAIYFCKRTKQDDPPPYEPMANEEDKKATTV